MAISLPHHSVVTALREEQLLQLFRDVAGHASRSQYAFYPHPESRAAFSAALQATPSNIVVVVLFKIDTGHEWQTVTPQIAWVADNTTTLHPAAEHLASHVSAAIRHYDPSARAIPSSPMPVPVPAAAPLAQTPPVPPAPQAAPPMPPAAAPSAPPAPPAPAAAPPAPPAAPPVPQPAPAMPPVPPAPAAAPMPPMPVAAPPAPPAAPAPQTPQAAPPAPPMQAAPPAPPAPVAPPTPPVQPPASAPAFSSAPPVPTFMAPAAAAPAQPAPQMPSAPPAPAAAPPAPPAAPAPPAPTAPPAPPTPPTPPAPSAAPEPAEATTGTREPEPTPDDERAPVSAEPVDEPTDEPVEAESAASTEADVEEAAEAAEASEAMPSDVDAELDEDSIDELDRTIVAPRHETRVEWTLIDGNGTRVQLEQFAVVGRRPAKPAELAAVQLIALPDPEKMLSKTHALIEVGEDGAWVTDLGSTNGTELIENGTNRECAADERVAVPAGARLQFGSVEIELVREETE